MADWLSEYLVRIGFSVDAAGYSKFAATLRDASSLVDVSASKIAKKFIEVQSGVTGAFASVGAGLIGMADKAATADQEYRLFALRMYTTLPVARELKIALDALGQPLENIWWDPELARRFNQLVKDQQTLTRELGPNFERSMLRIRDLRFELTRFGVEAEYLGMILARDIGKIFGVDLDAVLGKLREFNDWFIENLPTIASWLEGHLKPVMVDVKDVLFETWDLLKLTGTAFSNVVGMLSGDRSIEGTAINFEQMARAIQHVTDWLSDFVKGVIHAEEIVLHLINAMSLATSGKMVDAWKEFTAAGKLVNPESAGTIGAVAGAAGGPIGAAVGSALGISIGAIADVARRKSEHLGDVAQMAPGYAYAAAKQLGIPVQWIIAQWAEETGGFTSRGAELNNLGGIMRNISKDPRNPLFDIRMFDTLGDFNQSYISTLQDKIKRWGHVPQNLTDFTKMLYGEGPKSYVQSGRMEDYLAGMVGYMAKMNTPSVNVTVNVNQPGASAHDIGRAAASAITEQWQKRSQRNTQEFSGWLPGGSDY